MGVWSGYILAHQAYKFTDMLINGWLQCGVFLASVLWSISRRVSESIQGWTYTGDHFLAPGVMVVIVAFGEDVVLARLEAGGVVIPRRALVG